VSFLAQTGFTLGSPNLPSFGLLGGLVVVDDVFRPLPRLCVATSIAVLTMSTFIAIDAPLARAVYAPYLVAPVTGAASIDAVCAALPTVPILTVVCREYEMECLQAGDAKLLLRIAPTAYIVRPAVAGGVAIVTSVAAVTLDVSTGVVDAAHTVKVDKTGAC
jgi:hypothetical protein